MKGVFNIIKIPWIFLKFIIPKSCVFKQVSKVMVFRGIPCSKERKKKMVFRTYAICERDNLSQVNELHTPCAHV